MTRPQVGADHVVTLDTTRPDVVEGDCSCGWWTAQATVRLVEAAHRGHLEGLAERGDQ